MTLRGACAEVPLEWRPAMRYLAFVVATIALALVVMVLWVWGGEGSLWDLAEMLVVLPVFGVVLWGPVAMLAIIPGRSLFRRVRCAVPHPQIGTALAAIAVSALSTAVVMGLVGLLLGDLMHMGPLGLLMFGCGAPSAVLAGLWVYAGEVRDDV